MNEQTPKGISVDSQKIAEFCNSGLLPFGAELAGVFEKLLGGNLPRGKWPKAARAHVIPANEQCQREMEHALQRQPDLAEKHHMVLAEIARK